jgi:hypothetical protein
MDSTALIISLVAGMVGTGMLMFGKSTRRMVPIGAGLALLTCPYFIPNNAALLIVCLALTAVPFVVRDG